MTGRDFATEVTENIGPEESLEDVIAMIDIVGEERAARRRRRVEQTDYEFAGAVLCPLFRIIKLPDFIRRADQFRLRFRGISGDPVLQRQLRDSMRPEVAEIEDFRIAIRLQFDRLFRHSAAPG